MKRLFFFISASFFLSIVSFANHITGGEMYYTLVSQNGNNYTYRVTLKLYRDCFSTGAALDPTAAIAVFDRTTGAMVVNNNVPRAQIQRLEITTPNPCITNPPVVCYEVGYYQFDVTLPGSPGGYIISYQRCCRIAGINNLIGSSNVGATYIADIPGTSLLPTAPANNSAQFIGPDTVVVCANNAFSYSFAATDADGDQLNYFFCEAIPGGAPGAPAPNPPSPPPYGAAPYNFPFLSTQPLGSSISVNPTTGLLTGIAPETGIYVVTVCVTETRNGQVIATQRKDLQIKVGDCNIAAATLNPSYITCDGFTLSFNNLSNSPLINSYYWDFGDPSSGANNEATIQNPTHTFSDTGVYTIKLVTNRNQQCSDSTTALVSVFPGFFPGFTSSGICVINPVFFTDTTRAVYGVVDSWKWNFGDAATLADTSRLQNPQWTYSSIGPKTIELIVSSSKGCIDTVSQIVDIIDRPPIDLAFRDTLICVPDVLQLQASGTGVFSWVPGPTIINTNSPTPTVNPTSTTTYYVNLDLSGCVNTDSVRVRVVDFVSLSAMPDTTICLSDPVQLSVVSDGLQYSWTPAATLNEPLVSNPIATPAGTTTYQVTARIGNCSATDDVTIFTIPYPAANAGNDTTICYNTTAQLNGNIQASSFVWSPLNYLNNPNILNPLATPPRTSSFILTVFDTLGCPKPGRDTVVVFVLPRILADAGRDTNVVVGQPLQLQASGGLDYIWSPATGLSSTTVSNPVGLYDGSIDEVRYRVDVFNEVGCADSAFVTVKIFRTVPQVFVPTAFTPNGDGLNDVVRPIGAGIQRINYFRIFNRWGQMVFSTTIDGQGWDGTIGGKLQGSNTFVWMVGATDYLGNPFFKKGTVTLIR